MWVYGSTVTPRPEYFTNDHVQIRKKNQRVRFSTSNVQRDIDLPIKDTGIFNVTMRQSTLRFVVLN